MKKIDKTASLFIMIVILFNIFPLPVRCAEETVSISTVGDFTSFTEKCVYDDYSKNRKFVLQNDIDLSGVEIKSAEVFCGIFEGGGHSIKNVKLSFEGSEKGLFCTVTKDGQIRDLNITGEIRTTDDTGTESFLRQRATSILSQTDLKQSEAAQTGAQSLGGIAGYNEGKIINCSYGGSINGKRRVGGIVGYNAMSGLIDTCSNAADIEGDSETGGIAGYNEGRIKLSKNNGKVCSQANENTINAGGICGNNKGAVVICTNNGIIGGEKFGDNIGGICGIQSGEIRECINNELVRGRRSVGGICGRFEPYTDIDLSYESAKAAITEQAEIMKNDIESGRAKLIDYAADLLGGKGIIDELVKALGLKDSVSNAGLRLDNLSRSAENMMNSITNAVNSASEENISGSLKDTLDQVQKSLEDGGNNLSAFTDEAKQSLQNVSDSLGRSLQSMDNALGEFEGKGEEISNLIDNMNSAVDEGKADFKESKSQLTERLDRVETSFDDVSDNLDKTHEEITELISQLKRTTGNIDDSVTDTLYDLDRMIINMNSDLRSFQKKIHKMIDTINNDISTLPTLPPMPTLGPLPTLRPGIVLPSDIPQTNENDEAAEGYNVVPDETLENGYDVETTIIGKLSNLLFTKAYAAEEKTAISDLKSTDISLPRLIGGENADTALIKYCVNNGEVDATEMTGGVVGSTGFESAVRSGENITLPDGTKVNSDSVLKAVIDGCISYGDITSQSKYAGGICGRSDIGNIKNSLATGEITTTDEGYAGGIAGMSSADIFNCIAVNDISGKDYIGGIAGSGKNISYSYALPRLDGNKNKSGAVAGFVSGEAVCNYFIDEGLSGIAGMNLEGRAEAVKPDEMISSDGNIPNKLSGLQNGGYYMSTGDLYLPQINFLAKNNAENIGAMLQAKSDEMARFHFKVVFCDRGSELKSMTVDYGTVLQDGDIPKLSADGSDVAVWDKDVKNPIVRHTVFTAVYNKAATTLSSDEEPPVILIESIFDEGTNMSYNEEYVDYDFNGYEKGKAYSFQLDKKAYGVIKVHIRDEKKKADKIGVQIDGKWVMTDCSIDGSYAVFEAASPCRFVVLYKKSMPILPVICIMGIIAVVFIIFIAGRRIRLWRKQK